MEETNIIVTLNPTAQEFNPTTPIPLSAAVGVPYPYPYFAVVPPPHLSPSPTRSILLSPVPPTVTVSDLRKDLEAFGDVRAIQTEALRYGIVTVDFYDLRNAETAFTAIRTHHVHCVSFFNPFYHLQFNAAPPPPPPGLVAGVPLWAHYVFPEAQNQGTLVVFNVDADVSPHVVRQVFEPFGAIKEVRDTLGKRKNQIFVEFFDIRDAAKGMKEMDGKEINGKQIAIEFSRGYGRKFFHSTNPFYVSKNPPMSPRGRFGSRYHSPQSPHLSHKNFKFNRGGGPSRVGSMSSISLNGEEVYSPRINFGSGEGTWNWKGRQARNKNEARFLIKEDVIVDVNSKDSRTTLMIKNIPNKYTQKLLLNMLDNHCVQCNDNIGDGEPLSSYDFVYLPIDFKNKCNVGYGFVNMTSPEATIRLYQAFHHQTWEIFNSRKICHLNYARIQGLEALKDHFKNSKFPCEIEHYLPVIFSPPRDGKKQLTTPIPVVGMAIPVHPNPPPVDDEIASSGGGSASAPVSKKSGGMSNDDDDNTTEVK